MDSTGETLAYPNTSKGFLHETVDSSEVAQVFRKLGLTFLSVSRKNQICIYVLRGPSFDTRTAQLASTLFPEQLRVDYIVTTVVIDHGSIKTGVTH